MFGKELAHDESYYKEYGDYKIVKSYTVYEAYIEPMFDKEGKAITNKDGSPRYRYYDDKEVTTLKQDVKVKEIRENLYKDVYEVNGDIVEKVEREAGKRAYFVVDEARIKTLKEGTPIVRRNDAYKVVNEVGYVLVDDYEIEKPKVIAVRKFKTDDHVQEAKDIIKAKLGIGNEED